MLDHLCLSLPFYPTCFKTVGTHSHLIKDPSFFGLPMASRSISRDANGHLEVTDLFHPFESVPSSHSQMAVKLFNLTQNVVPHVQIKASPAKLMQGHNVYGGESIEQGALEMIGLLFESYPELAPWIDLRSIEVLHLDATYSSTLQHAHHVHKVIDYFSRIQNGRTAPRKGLKYDTTCYWNGAHSRLVQLKCYAKAPEMETQIKDISKKADAGDAKSKMLMRDVYTEQLKIFAHNKLRWEARIKKRKLERLGLPTNLIELIKHQNSTPDFLKDLWTQLFKPVHDTLKGANMDFSDDDQTFDMLKSKLKTTTASGRTSYTRARNAMNFFHLIRDIGLPAVKDRYSSSTFYDNLNNLINAGISKAWLQNCHTEKRGKVVPLIRFCEVNFASQTPTGYVPPVSRFDLRLAA